MTLLLKIQNYVVCYDEVMLCFENLNSQNNLMREVCPSGLENMFEDVIEYMNRRGCCGTSVELCLLFLILLCDQTLPKHKLTTTQTQHLCMFFHIAKVHLC